MSGKWFKRLLLSYLPVVPVIVFVLLLLFVLMVNRISAGQARQANQVFAEQALSALELSLRKVDQVVMKEMSDPDGLNLFFKGDVSDRYESLYGPSQQLNVLMGNLVEIDSMYLYRKADGTVLTRDSVLAADSFGDEAFIRAVEAEGASPRWMPVRDYAEFAGEEPRRVVSVVRQIPLLTGEQGFAVVNVNVRTIAALLRDMSVSKLSFVDLLDRDGQYVVKSSPDGLRSRLATAGSTYAGWHIEYGWRDAGAFRSLSYLPYIWIALVLVTAAFATVWIVVVTRRNYKPLEEIMLHIRDAGLKRSRLVQPASGGVDEFKFIEHAFTELLERSEEIELKRQDDLQFRRQQIFQDLLLGHRQLSESLWRETAALCGFPERWRQLSVAVAGIDRHAAFAQDYSPRDQALLKFVIKSVVAELAAKRRLAVWAEWMDARHLAMLLVPPDGERHDTEAVAALYGELNEWVRANLRLTITIGVGTDIAEPVEIPDAYEEALTAWRYKAVGGFDRVITMAEVRRSGGERFYGYEAIRELVELFRQGDQGWEQAGRRLFEGLGREAGSHEDIMAAMDYLNYRLNCAVSAMADDYRVYWETAVAGRLNGIGDRTETLDEVQAQYMLLLREAAQHYAGLREHRGAYAQVQRIRQYIDEEYANPELSLALISERFELSSKYVSQLFREETGVKFVDYLARLRIERAKELLERSDLPIQEVAVQIGYTQALSFIRMFKKIENMTPGDYRKQAKR